MNKKLKRGVNGALVTAMAATPVLAFPMDKAHAEDTDSILDSMDMLEAIKNELTEAESNQLAAAKELFRSNVEWSDFTQFVNIDGLEQEQKEEFIQDVVNIMNFTSYADLFNTVDDFKSTYNGDGPGQVNLEDTLNVSFNEFLEFLVGMQSNAFEYMQNNRSDVKSALDSNDDDEYRSLLNSAYSYAIDELNTPGSTYSKLNDKVYFGEDGIMGYYIDLIYDGDDPDTDGTFTDDQEDTMKDAQTVLVQALYDATGDPNPDPEPPTTDPDPDPTPDPDPDPDPTPDPEPEPQPEPEPEPQPGDIIYDVDPEDDQVLVDEEAVDVVEEETADGKTRVNVNLNADRIQESIQNLAPEQVRKITIKIFNGNDANRIPVFNVPSKAVKAIAEKNPDAVLEVGTEDAAYELPVKEIDLPKLAQDLGADSEDDVDVEIQVNTVEETDEEVVRARTTSNLNIVSPVIEFKVRALSGTNMLDITRFTSYVPRTIVNQVDYNPTYSTGVLVKADGTIMPIPTVFTGTTATLKSQTNSKYTVVENDDVSFTDIADLWNKEQVEKLAAKYIVQGKEDGSFEPQSSIRRSEFSALVSRSLALLADENAELPFTDIRDSKWYADPIAAVYEAGIVQGREDGSFDPDAELTRLEGVLMLDRLFEYVGYDSKELNEQLEITAFEDEGSIPTYARDAVERMVQAGVINGRGNGNFDPYGKLDRAAMVKVLDESLEFVGFISED